MLHDRDSVFVDDRMLRISQQLEVQAFLGAEFFVRIHGIKADAENDSLLLLILVDVSLEIVGLNGASAGEILGVEVKHNPLAFKLVERNLRAFLVGQSEGRCGAADRRLCRICGHRAERQGKGKKKYHKKFHKAPFKTTQQYK